MRKRQVIFTTPYVPLIDINLFPHLMTPIQENLDVKDRKISTTQTAEELKRSFRPGKEFGFNVIIEPESSQDSS